MNRLFSLALIAITFPFCTICQADRPLPGPESLLEMSSHTIQGKISQIYSANEDKGNFRYVFQIAVVDVKTVEKGEGISKGDSVYVKYWKRTWIGKGPLPPDYYGQPNVPRVGDSMRVFLKQDKNGPFDVREPGGFHSVPSE